MIIFGNLIINITWQIKERGTFPVIGTWPLHFRLSEGTLALIWPSA